MLFSSLSEEERILLTKALETRMTELKRSIALTYDTGKSVETFTHIKRTLNEINFCANFINKMNISAEQERLVLERHQKMVAFLRASKSNSSLSGTPAFELAKSFENRKAQLEAEMNEVGNSNDIY